MYSIVLIGFLGACSGSRLPGTRIPLRRWGISQDVEANGALYRSRLSRIRLHVVSEVRPWDGGGIGDEYGDKSIFDQQQGESELESILRSSPSGGGVSSRVGGKGGANSRWVEFPNFVSGRTTESTSLSGLTRREETGALQMDRNICPLDYGTVDIAVDSHQFVNFHLPIDAPIKKSPEKRIPTKKPGKSDLKNYSKRSKLLKTIKGHTQNNRISKVLSCFRDKTAALSIFELNYLATDTIRCLGASGAGNARYCLDVLQLMEAMKALPDLYTYTSAMSVLNKHHMYEEVLSIMDKVVSSDAYDLDVKFFENSVRAAGHVRSWDDLLSMLDQACIYLSPLGILPVVHSAMTNLKYSENTLSNPSMSADIRSSASSSSSTSTSTSTTADVRVTQSSSSRWTNRAFDLLSWLGRQGLKPEVKTLDASLAVVCAHGSAEDAERILQRMSELRITPTYYTYNTVLDRCAEFNHLDGALHVLGKMRMQGLDPDATTFNTLLKLCVQRNDMNSARQIVTMMKSKHVHLSDYAKNSMIRLLSSHGEGYSALNIIDSEPDDIVTTPMFVNAVKSLHSDWKEALRLLQRAHSLVLVDEALLAAVAQSCFLAHEYEAGLTLSRAFFFQQEGYRMNKYMLSILVGGCLGYIATSRGGIAGEAYLVKVLNNVSTRTPHLLTSSVCQRLMRELPLLHKPSLAASLHLQHFSQCTCSSDVLLALFVNLQKQLPLTFKSETRGIGNGDNGEDIRRSQKQIAQLSLAVTALYIGANPNPTFASSETDMHNVTNPHYNGNSGGYSNSSRVNMNKRNIIRTSHLNRLLRILFEAGMYSEAVHISHMMQASASASASASTIDKRFSGRGSGSGSADPFSLSLPQDEDEDVKVQEDDDDEDRNVGSERGQGTAWRPSTFTIAESVRCAKGAEDPMEVVRVVKWGLREAVLLPEGVISDALSYLFSRGQTELVQDLYSTLYEAGKVNHWSDRDKLELDLHNYSRGMAYAAISIALEEARDIEEALSNAAAGSVGGFSGVESGVEGTQDTFPDMLTVITGRSEGRESSSSSGSSNSNDSNDSNDSNGGDTRRPRRSKEKEKDKDKERMDGYVLSREVQDVLIECFYPPVPSYTVPGNSGRLLVPYRLQTSISIHTYKEAPYREEDEQ